MSRTSRAGAPLAALLALSVALLPAATAGAVGPADPPAGVVLVPTPVAGSDAPTPTVEGIAAAVAPALTRARLGAHSAVVLDAATGEVLFGERPDVARVPASTMKLLTAAAALDRLGPDARLRTEVRVDDRSARQAVVTLVGGGDSTLTREPDGPWASLAALADLVAAELAVDSVVLQFDASAFRGPRLGPGWPSSFPAAGVAAPVSALMVDQGRVRPGASSRVANPARQAAGAFAALLRERGLTVTDVRRGTAGAGSEAVAAVESPPMGTLVDRMLADSDNDLAEAIAHVLGGTVLQDPSFAGGAAAVEQAVDALELPVEGLDIADGSGLSGRNRASATLLAELLAEAARGDSAVLSGINDGLAVAGLTGTLADRFGSADSAAGAGVVRAKTGTLTGVVSLAGQVRTADGRVLAFAVIGNRVGSTAVGRRATDRFAAELADCGCR